MNEVKDAGRLLGEFSHAMKRDWDERARSNAKWFINTLKLEQSDDEFDASGERDVKSAIIDKLGELAPGKNPKQLRVLELGCGIGRMTKFLASIFGEVHATDVSGEMIARARERLAHLPNVVLYETSGVDLQALPSDYFDLVFSLYVFQHVPSAAVIRSNLDEALRTLKPGGILRFQTSSITAFDYEGLEKDTWTGASFPETEIRCFADENDAQLISLLGAGTQFCITTVRKHARAAGGLRCYALATPEIVSFGRADAPEIKAIATEGDYNHLTLIVAGLNPVEIDANCLSVEINGQVAHPQYVGPLGENYRAALQSQFGSDLARLTQVNQQIPFGLAAGTTPICVRLRSGETTPAINVELYDPPPTIPKIMAFNSEHAEWIDEFTHGTDAVFRLLVEGLDLTADPGNVRVQIGERICKPLSIVYAPANALYIVRVALPANLPPSEYPVSLYFGNLQSPERSLRIK
jgi:SAM-dependent methyltransferase